MYLLRKFTTLFLAILGITFILSAMRQPSNLLETENFSNKLLSKFALLEKTEPANGSHTPILRSLATTEVNNQFQNNKK